MTSCGRLLSLSLPVAIGLGLSTQRGEAQATIVDVATDATDPNNLGDQEPSIAVNPRNRQEIVVVSFSGNWADPAGATLWRSVDGGRTWLRVSIANAPPAPAAGQTMVGPADRKIAYDSLGNLYIAELAIVYNALGARVNLLDFV